MDNSFRKGSRKKWVCCDSVNCSWELRMTKKPRSRSDRTYWTKEIPCGHWYVSSMSLSHDKNCISQYQVSKDELKNLDGFKGSFTHGVHTSRNRVISSVSNVNKIDISSNILSSTIYRAIRETEDKKTARLFRVYLNSSLSTMLSQRQPRDLRFLSTRFGGSLFTMYCCLWTIGEFSRRLAYIRD